MAHRSAVPTLYLLSLALSRSLSLSLSLTCLALALLHITQLLTAFLGVSLVSVPTIEDQNSFGLTLKNNNK